MSDMRVLTVRQPWAWAIIHAGKDVENRVRNIAGTYRGPVAIHAGLAEYEQDNEASRAHWAARGKNTDTTIVFGAIIGVVDLLDVHHSTTCPNQTTDYAPWPLCSQWAQRDAWHLVLTNQTPLPKPVPYRGALGLRRLDQQLAGNIRLASTRATGFPVGVSGGDWNTPAVDDGQPF